MTVTFHRALATKSLSGRWTPCISITHLSIQSYSHP